MQDIHSFYGINLYIYSPPTLVLSHNTGSISLRGDLLLVGVDGAVELVNSTAVANPETSADTLQHGHIVGDHHHTSLEQAECIRQGIHTLDIQVIGRFVKNKNVRIGQGQASKCNTRFLTSRQQFHALETGCTSDTKAIG